MKRHRQSAFSLIELLTVISIIAILASMLLVAMSSARAKSRQTACVNNLHQIGLGFTGFALDHEGKYPMDLPERLGGSMEYNQSLVISNTPFSRDFHHFRALSNEVPNVKIMLCPADRRRRPARDYRSFTNDNLSYWVNTKALPHATLATLAGDWNVHNAGSANNLTQITFGREVHRRQGSVLFADGRVEITRSISVATPQPEPAVATLSSDQPPAQAAGVPTNARPQPASLTPPPAVPTVAPPAPANNPAAAPKDDPENKKRADSEVARTNQTAKLPIQTQVQMGGGYRMTLSGGGASPPAATIPDSPPRAFNTPGGPSAPPEDPDPWDTPRFRMFKALAFVSYLISLLWALIALLLLYLRSRIAQRQAEERGAAIHVD